MDNQNNFIERINNINNLPNHAQIQNVQEIANVQQAFIDSIDPLINTSAFENARIIVQGLDSVIATYRPVIEQVQIAFDSMSQTINSLVDSINFDRISTITENVYLTVNALTESLNDFYNTEYASISETIVNSLDSVTLENYELLQHVLSEYSVADSFSEVEQEQLLNATEFVSNQLVQEPNEIEQDSASMVDSYTDKHQENNKKTNKDIDQFYDTKKYDKTKPNSTQSQTPSFKEILLDKEEFYRDTAKFLRKLLIQLFFYYSFGWINENLFQHIVKYLLTLFESHHS